MAAIPVDARQVLNLTALGIPAEAVGFRNVTLDSDKAVCVRLESGDAKSVQIVSLQTGAVVQRFPMAAESAILSPDGKTIAVRAGTALQVFNLELQKKIKSHKLPDAEAPVFWTWVGPHTIGLVTGTAVYHWSSEGESAPDKKFDRAPHLAGTQVISYAQSEDGQWLMLVGIKAGAPGGPAEGAMQLYSVEKKVSQPLQAHAGCFTTASLPGRSDKAILFCFVDLKPGAGPKLMIIEVGKDKSAPGGVFRLAPQDLPQPADAAADFPVSVCASKSKGVVYILTKMGYCYVFDIATGGIIFRHRISETPVFAATIHEASGGVLAIAARTGAVSLLTLNEAALVPYVSTVLKNTSLAMALAGRLGLAGADDLYVSEFNRYITAGDIEGAARCAAGSPGGVLRNAATMARFQQLPTPEGGQPPFLRYCAVLMESGKLNKVESVELSRPALAQGRVQLLEKWLTEDKVTCSEQLGDMVMPLNPKLALTVYLRSGEAHEKVVQALLQTGEFGKIIPYCAKAGYKPNFVFILQNLVHANPGAAKEFAVQLVKNDSGAALVEVPTILDVFMQFQRLQECTAFLLEVLAGDRPEEGYLQTRLLELNLLGGAPQVVHAILGSNMFHHFDKPRVAALCEKAGLHQRALELYSDIKDIRRVLSHVQAGAAPGSGTGGIDAAFLCTYFGSMTAEHVLECLAELLRNPQNEAAVVQVATKYSDALTPEELIKVFEAAKSPNGLYYFLGGIVNTSENKTVHYKYIVAAAQLKQVKEVERVCRDSTVYDPVAVRDFLLDAKLQDPRPLIHVCDRFGFVDELTSYLWSNGNGKFIEVYCQKVAPAKTPQVVGRLLDLDADEDFIKALLNSVRVLVPVEPLVEEVEKRNRLRLLQPWLETRVAEGATDAAVHNAVGKIYVTINRDPQAWLRSNTFYDSRVVGRFCEKLDPFLAYLAYKRAGGACDDELIAVTSKNGLWKDQARYLVERQDLALWERVLTDENPHRRELIDCVTGTALPETSSPDEVSTTVKAFMNAKLPNELIGLLEKLVLGHANEKFSSNRNLQNLLILTAIKCAHEPGAPEGRAMDFITRLDGYDGKEIARIALRDEYGLYEEAFAIYSKFNLHVEAVGVLLEKKGDLDRAGEYAQRVGVAEVWSLLAKAQLDADAVSDAIASYCKASDASAFEAVIAVAEREGKFEDLIKYLDMARKGGIKERAIDSALVYSYAQTGRLGDLESFISSPNTADIQAAGDKCFEEGLFAAARLCYTAASNYPKLAATLVQLGLFREAVDASRKANSIRTWKEVSAACVRAGEWKLAQTCGLSIIVAPDHVDDLVYLYEAGGHIEQLLALFEQGVGLEAAHAGVFTELGVLYSKYAPGKLMEHCKAFAKRVNISRLLRACEAGRHWAEAVYLLQESGDVDGAVRTQMEHPSVAFSLDSFLASVRDVRNGELFYAAITFFLEEEPASLPRLLSTLSATGRLDHARVVHLFRKTPDNLPLIAAYLKAAQGNDIPAVNEAYNALLVDEEDVAGLRTSIDAHANFDQVALAQRLEKHELLEFRRVAALLYKRNKRWDASISLSKGDACYKDAIDTAAESGDGALAEGLLAFFTGKGDKESFAACLYTCYTLVRPDVVLELAWRHRLTDYAMPFLIQFTRDATARITSLEKKVAAGDKSGAGGAGGEHADAADAGAHAGGYGGYGMPGGVLALTDYAHNPAAAVGGFGGAAPPPPLGGMTMPGAGVGGYGVGVAAPPLGGMGGFVPPPPLGGAGPGFGGAAAPGFGGY